MTVALLLALVHSRTLARQNRSRECRGDLLVCIRLVVGTADALGGLFVPERLQAWVILDRRLNAMVYVFCVQTATSHDVYDQLNVAQWDFYVVPRIDLALTDQNSLGIARVKSLSGGATAWDDLKAAVTAAAVGQERDDDRDWWGA